VPWRPRANGVLCGVKTVASLRVILLCAELIDISCRLLPAATGLAGAGGRVVREAPSTVLVLTSSRLLSKLDATGRAYLFAQRLV